MGFSTMVVCYGLRSSWVTGTGFGADAVAICVDEGSLTSAGMVAVAGLGMIRLLTNAFGCIHHMLRHYF